MMMMIIIIIIIINTTVTIVLFITNSVNSVNPALSNQMVLNKEYVKFSLKMV
jgi:hypothetical protein